MFIFPPLLIVQLQIWGEGRAVPYGAEDCIAQGGGRALQLTINTNSLNMSQGCQKIGSQLKASSQKPP